MHPFLLSFHFFFPCQLFIHTLHSTAIASRETCSQVGFGVWGWLQGQSICGESFFSGGGGAQENAAFFLRFQWNSCQKACLLFWGPDKICFRTLVFRVGGMLASDSKGDRDCVYMRCSSVHYTFYLWHMVVQKHFLNNSNMMHCGVRVPA